jgi:hypothetical protein
MVRGAAFGCFALGQLVAPALVLAGMVITLAGFAATDGLGAFLWTTVVLAVVGYAAVVLWQLWRTGHALLAREPQAARRAIEMASHEVVLAALVVLALVVITVGMEIPLSLAVALAVPAALLLHAALLVLATEERPGDAP